MPDIASSEMRHTIINYPQSYQSNANINQKNILEAKLTNHTVKHTTSKHTMHSN